MSDDLGNVERAARRALAREAAPGMRRAGIELAKAAEAKLGAVARWPDPPTEEGARATLAAQTFVATVANAQATLALYYRAEAERLERDAPA